MSQRRKPIPGGRERLPQELSVELIRYGVLVRKRTVAATNDNPRPLPKGATLVDVACAQPQAGTDVVPDNQEDSMEATMTTLCQVSTCDQISETVLIDLEGLEIEVCTSHLRDILTASDGEIRVLRLLRPRQCFNPTCNDSAVTIVATPDHSQRPVCRRHWDDLSWVDEPQDLLPTAPGWSSS